MESQFIIPFVQAVKNVLGTMLKTSVSFGKPRLKDNGHQTHAVSAIISYTGSVTGSVVLSVPEATAVALVKRFTGMEMAPDNPDFADAVGELTNMIAGGAKAAFNRDDVAIGCPSVVIGRDHQIYQRKDQPIIVIPCQCDAGAFDTEVALKTAANAAARPQAAVA